MKRALWLAGCSALICGSMPGATVDEFRPAGLKNPPAVNPSTGAVLPGPADALHTSSVVAPVNPHPDVAPSAPAAVVTSLPDQPASAMDFSTTDPEEMAKQTLEISRQNMSRPPVDLEARLRQQREIQDEHDWLLRGYQEQLRKNGLDKTPITQPNPYERVSTDRTADGSSPPTDPLLAQPVPVRKTQAPDRNPLGNDDSKSPSNSFNALALPPLLPPLNPSDATPLVVVVHNSFGPDETVPDFSSSATNPVIPPATSQSSMLDIPGLTAAEEGMSSHDLSFEDRLPDEPADQHRSPLDPSSYSIPTAPLTDTDAFFKKQSESLRPPNAPTFQVLAPPVAPTPYQEPKPTAKPVVDGLRNHIADPFDILNRPHPDRDR